MNPAINPRVDHPFSDFKERFLSINMKKLKMADHLPRDVIVLILLRLPSKSLIRFRSVCKSWLSLISSTQFRLRYLPSNFSRTLVRRISRPSNKEIYTIHFNDQHLTLDTRFSIEFPFNLYRDGNINLKTIGCCNGVICLSEIKRDETILWNPSIRKKLTLIPPIHRYNRDQNWHLVFGFGYDKTTDDYKVVRLAYHHQFITITRPHVEVYTVKTAIWREVEFPHDLTCFCLLPPPGYVPVFFNGSAHWISYSTSRPTHSSILTFDMSTEIFGEIQLPKKLAQEHVMSLGLVVLEESLGVIYYNRVIKKLRTYKIWAMKEYKKPMTWTMIYKLRCPAGRTLGLTNDGGLMVASRQGDLKIYNQEGCYNVFGCGSRHFELLSIFVERYEESLALLDVGDDVKDSSK